MSEKNVLNFRKQKGKHDKIKKLFASGNANIGHVTSFIFDVIGRFCIKILYCQQTASNTLQKRQKHRKITICHESATTV